MTKYTYDFRDAIPSCLPSSLNKANLIEITELNTGWKKYIDIETGIIHDCHKHHLEATKEPMSIEMIEQLVIDWGNQRGITKPENINAQIVKLCEEFG